MEPLIKLSEPARARIRAREAEAHEQADKVRGALRDDFAQAHQNWGGYFDLHKDQLANAEATAHSGFLEVEVILAQLVFHAHATEYRQETPDVQELAGVLSAVRESVIKQHGEHTRLAIQRLEAQQLERASGDESKAILRTELESTRPDEEDFRSPLDPKIIAAIERAMVDPTYEGGYDPDNKFVQIERLREQIAALEAAIPPRPVPKELEGLTFEPDCAEPRNAWLDSMLEPHGWSDLDFSKQPNAPSYNTIRRYRRGETSQQDRSVRWKIAKALKVLVSEVPE